MSTKWEDKPQTGKKISLIHIRQRTATQNIQRNLKTQQQESKNNPIEK